MKTVVGGTDGAQTEGCDGVDSTKDNVQKALLEEESADVERNMKKRDAAVTPKGMLMLRRLVIVR